MAANNNNDMLLAVKAREIFTAHAVRVLEPLAKAVQEKLLLLVNSPASGLENQERRDAWQAFQAGQSSWINNVNRAWSKPYAGAALAAAPKLGGDSLKFELIGDEVMENQILASRLALRLLDFASWELSDLRLRIQNLEGVSELHKEDILRPEVIARHLFEQWTAAKLTRGLWLMVQGVVQTRLAEHLLDAYHSANEFLVQRGVMAEIDLRPLVKRTPSAVGNAPGQTSPPDKAAQLQTSPAGTHSTRSGQLGAPTGQGATSAMGAMRSGAGSQVARAEGSGSSAGPDQMQLPAQGLGAQASQASRAAANQAAHEETRMQTATTPLARARMRAQGVMGHLKRLLTNQVAGFEETRAAEASPQLQQALTSAEKAAYVAASTYQIDSPGMVYSPVHVEQAAAAMRERTSNLKQAATTQTEKATIEIVALMFQSILAEDRIPAVVRVWFARLQMPVLRVALSEPEFFESLQHPARRLIDRMGSVVLGFDADVSGNAMELEIKRVVQVIEQYPETGRRVFQLVYDEFQKFLSRFLTQQGSATRVISVAQQVEQKETMAIQYTIEMRNMLNDMPVREEIRDFLFKIWSEVLAIASVRNGPQHADTIMLKRGAADLVWAASAKPNRADRAKVIADLPKLLQLLRSGMSMLNMGAKAQDLNIKIISDTLADAFMSKNGAISAERIDMMAQRLANLEDYLSEEDVGDLPLDMENLVTMIGIDASDITVITDGGSQPNDAMRAWALELQLGAWFSLDHNGKMSHIQFAWRSDRQQLHLFAAADGRNFLIQARRLAAYLQAGLLVPTEEETLTVRATRDALAKLDANPERLLS